MAVVSKKKTVVKNPQTEVAEKKVAPKKVAEEVKETKAVEKKTTSTGGKKILTKSNKAVSKNFEIREGTQATQEAFIDKFYKKLVNDYDYDISKKQAMNFKKAYSETLKEVLEIASFQDTDAGIFYARRYIESRVTAPPKAKDELKTLMKGHYEIKVRKLIGDESQIKFFGDLNEDGTVFITTTGEEIPLTEEVEVKPVAKKKVAAKKPTPVVEEEVEEEEIEEEEVVEDATEEEDEDFDDFLEDEDEE